MKSIEQILQRDIIDSGGYYKKGGFRKIKNLEDDKICRHPEHNPPSHIYLEDGIYEYTCPACGKETVITIRKLTL